MARPKPPLVLTDAQKCELIRRTVAPSSTLQSAFRARIILRAAEGLDSSEIASQLGTSRVTVGLWRSRFLDLGLAGLDSFQRSGRPTQLSDTKVHQVITEVIRPPMGRKRWSCRTMAKAAGISVGSVHRLWKQLDLQPHLTQTFVLTNTPDVERKFWDIVGLYLHPPTQAVVLCSDEEPTCCQALERSPVALPPGPDPGQRETQDAAWRQGTTPLFAVMNYVSGKVLQLQKSRHRHQDWLHFLQTIDRNYPGDMGIHLILDNYATHKHTTIKRWLEWHPRFRVHFTPTSASWMNLVELVFQELSHDRILPGSFGSVGELSGEILRAMEEWKLNPPLFEWKADSRRILERLSRTRAALAPAHQGHGSVR